MQIKLKQSYHTIIQKKNSTLKEQQIKIQSKPKNKQRTMYYPGQEIRITE
jgi:hypothetical protein